MMYKLSFNATRNAAFVLFFLCFFQLLSAQYKKVNIFTKSGRIYEMGINFRLQSGERSPSPGIFISAGRSTNVRRIHHWFDIGLNAGNRFDYKTVVNTYGSATPEPMAVKGKSGLDYNLNYTLGYYLADNSDPETLLLPFINVTIGYLSRIKYSEFNFTPPDYSPVKYPSDSRSMFIAGIGAGVHYRMNEKLGLRLSANYVSVTSSTSSYGSSFEELTNHPAIQLALRFNVVSDN